MTASYLRYGANYVGANLPHTLTADGDVVTDLATATTDAAAAVAAAPSTAAVVSAVAALVADGASPTQAHVTTLNTAWGTLLTAIGTLNTAVLLVQTDITAASGAEGSANVILSFDKSVITSKSILYGAVKALLRMIDGSSTLTGQMPPVF